MLCLFLGCVSGFAAIPDAKEKLFGDLIIRINDVKSEFKGGLLDKLVGGKHLVRVTAEIVNLGIDSKSKAAAPVAAAYLEKNAKDIDLLYAGYKDESDGYNLDRKSIRNNSYKVRVGVIVEGDGPEANIRAFFVFTGLGTDAKTHAPLWAHPSLKSLDPATPKAP